MASTIGLSLIHILDFVTGDIADYRTFTTSVEVEILDHEERKPVSYTHLDVYKRQVITSGSNLSAM